MYDDVVNMTITDGNEDNDDIVLIKNCSKILENMNREIHDDTDDIITWDCDDKPNITSGDGDDGSHASLGITDEAIQEERFDAYSTTSEGITSGTTDWSEEVVTTTDVAATTVDVATVQVTDHKLEVDLESRLELSCLPYTIGSEV